LRKKILVRAPVLTRSGYGEHGRLVCRALRSREDIFDIYVLPIPWGQTGWIAENNEEREWLDERIKETAVYGQSGGQFDISVQVTIPNEWQKMAPINVGVTAGIESDMVAPVWLEQANMMDNVITISEHSKKSYAEASYQGQHAETGQQMILKCNSPIDIVHYPAKIFKDLPELDMKFDYDFNYLVVVQNGPRKNLENTIKWFVEENIDQEVGLVVKTFIKNNSIVDRTDTERLVKKMLKDYPERKCKVYLLHGDMSDEEMHSLYAHPNIKCLISLSHGEGFGLPIFEAAYSALPVIAPGWSGHCDFLYAPHQDDGKKKKKKGKKPYFAEVEYSIDHIPDFAVWEGVLVKESKWCYPREGSYKMRLRQVRKNYDKWKSKADYLQKWVFDNFNEADIFKKFCGLVYNEDEVNLESWLTELNSEIVEHE
tara:strand:+ start:1266 stop:2546 length:1281 start_codon:yes stop_codon:yes gene_type:complete